VPSPTPPLLAAPTQTNNIVHVVAEDARMQSPGGCPRRLVFAHHAESAREGAARAARAQVERLAAGAALGGAAAATGGGGGGGGGAGLLGFHEWAALDVMRGAAPGGFTPGGFAAGGGAAALPTALEAALAGAGPPPLPQAAAVGPAQALW
jgi:hypothetical protein